MSVFTAVPIAIHKSRFLDWKNHIIALHGPTATPRPCVLKPFLTHHALFEDTETQFSYSIMMLLMHYFASII